MNRVPTKVFSVSRDFSKTPGARFKVEGKYSGEELREDYLKEVVLEAIKNDEKLVIDLDGTAGYGTSFLEEAFGGLIRVDGISFNDLKCTLEFKSDEEDYLPDDINEYMEEAYKDACK